MCLRWVATLALGPTLLLLGSCHSGMILNPTPVVAALFPDSVTAPELGPTACASAGPFPVSIVGTNFIATSQAMFNENNRTTSLNSTTGELTIELLACDIDMPGTGQISVSNPAPGGGLSGSLTLTINPPNNQAPTISSLSPPNKPAGGPSFTLTVTGTNFVSSSVVAFNGSPRATALDSVTGQLTATILAQDIAAPGTAAITVTNPAPGGGTSAPATFTITP